MTGHAAASRLGPERLSPVLGHDRITFFLEDRHRRYSGAALFQELFRPRNGPDFTYDEGAGGWVLELPRPEVDRMEYQIQIRHRDGGEELVCDPSNPLRAPGAFGDKSVAEFPGYRHPAWTRGSDDGSVRQIEVRSRPLRNRFAVDIWSPAGSEPDQPLPLLVAHDGPEYARFSSLTVFLSEMVAAGRIPPARAALVPPVDRDLTYSASAVYTRTFAHDVLPAILNAAPTPHGRSKRIGMGASLGGLAMLHIHRRAPASFGAVYLQSGSFFRMRFDKQESGFVKFRRISRFVGELLTSEVWAHPIPITITCGTVEENLANNRAVAAALERQGYEVTLVENPDAHNWIAWRDTFDPHLADLLGRVWG